MFFFICRMQKIAVIFTVLFTCLYPKVLESKGKVKNKTKALKRKEDKERKNKGRIQGEDLKEPLADNDDSSSTTTETSNPDMVENIKEVNTLDESIFSKYKLTV